MSKSNSFPFPYHYSQSTAPFHVIHTDVLGIAPNLSRPLGYKCYVTFIDDDSHFTWIYFLCMKSNVLLPTFQKFYNIVHSRFDKNIKIVRSDSKGEYMEGNVSSYLLEKGVVHKKSCPCTSRQNGIVERKQRHIMKTVWALLFESFFPSTFWCEATHIVVYLINCLSTSSVNNISPYQCLYGHLPSYSKVRVFGWLFFVHLVSYDSTKLSHATKYAFPEYSDGKKKDFYDRTFRPNALTALVMLFLVNILYFYSSPSDYAIVQVSYPPGFAT